MQSVGSLFTVSEYVKYKNDVNERLRELKNEEKTLQMNLKTIDKCMYVLCNHVWEIEIQKYAASERKCTICNLYEDPYWKER